MSEHPGLLTLKLFSKYFDLCGYDTSMSRTDRQTEGPLFVCEYCALCSIAQ